MRKRWRWVLVGLAVALFALVFWPEPDRITNANLARIRRWTGRAEVEAILGPPYLTVTEAEVRPPPCRRVMGAQVSAPTSGTWSVWKKDERFFRVDWDSSGKHVEAARWENHSEKYGWSHWLLSRLWRWLP